MVNLSGKRTGEQKTCLATSIDGVNFSRYTDHTSGVSAVVLNPDGAHHTGYFRWGVNKFSGISYFYIGYALFKGSTNSILALYGSNNAINWDMVQFVNMDNIALGLPVGYEIKWVEIDPRSVQELPSGDYVALATAGTAAAGSVDRNTKTVELIIDNSGTLIKRCARVVIDNELLGIDENEVAQPCCIEYGENIVCFYQATNSDNLNRIAVASGVFDASEVVPPMRQPSNYINYQLKQNLINATQLDDWIEFVKSSTRTFSLGAYGCSLDYGNTYAQLRNKNALIPADYDMLEVWAQCNNVSSGVFYVTIGNDVAGVATTGVSAVVSGSTASEYQARVRVDGNTPTPDVLCGVASNLGRQGVGLRWYPYLEIVQLILSGKSIVYEWSLAGLGININTPVFLSIGSYQIQFIIEEFSVNARAHDTISPTITQATLAPNGQRLSISASETIDFGDGLSSGFTLNASGGPVNLRFAGGYGTDTLLFDSDREIQNIETATLSYTQPTDGWQDMSNNELASFSGMSVTKTVEEMQKPQSFKHDIKGTLRGFLRGFWRW